MIRKILAIVISAIAMTYCSTAAMAGSNLSIYSVPKGQSSNITYPSLPEVVPEAYYLASDGSDYGLAINRALATGYKVSLGCTTYNVATTIRYQVSGQIMQGCGSGFASDVGKTIIKWTGGTTGKVISFAATAGSGGVSNAQLRDLDVDGNSLANIGVEVYDNSSAAGGGNWRNSLSHVTIRNVTGGTNPHAIELGHSNSSPNWANDFSCYNCAVYNSNIGVWLNGSTESFYNSTIGFNTTYGVRIETGGQFFCHSCISQDNGIEVSAVNPGNISIIGGSYQNAGVGGLGVIVLDSGSTQMTVFVGGADLDTVATNLFNFQAAAGGFAIIGSKINPGSGAGITGCNPIYPWSTAGTSGLTMSGTCSTFYSSNVPSGSAVSLADITTAGITSIANVPAGTWDVSGVCVFTPAGSTVVNWVQCGVNSAGTMPTPPAACGFSESIGSATAGLAPTANVCPTRFTFVAPTTVYLLTQAHFSVSTLSAYGYLRIVPAPQSTF